MGVAGSRGQSRVNAAIAVALTGLAGAAAAQEVPTTFAISPLVAINRHNDGC